ncbi:MAG: response regulator [Simkaniaceae bacterium]
MPPPKKIIITDDDEDILTIIKLSLEDLDAEIKYCKTGEEMLSEAMHFKPDLVVLDIMMPEMDGLEALKALRLIPSLEKVPVIFLTAKAQKKEVEEYKKMQGIIGIITKPFDPMQLKDEILNIWQQYQK